MSVVSFWCIIVTHRLLQTYKMKRVHFSVSGSPGGSLYILCCLCNHWKLSITQTYPYCLSHKLHFDMFVLLFWPLDNFCLIFCIFSIFGSTGSSNNGHNSTKNITSNNIASYLILECPYHHFDALLSRTDYYKHRKWKGWISAFLGLQEVVVYSLLFV